jgi:hypothetical protein
MLAVSTVPRRLKPKQIWAIRQQLKVTRSVSDLPYLIATSFDERVAFGLSALLIAALGFYSFGKTGNRHGALLVANRSADHP